jgi:hypothetical protein
MDSVNYGSGPQGYKTYRLRQHKPRFVKDCYRCFELNYQLGIGHGGNPLAQPLAICRHSSFAWSVMQPGTLK